MRGAKFLGCLLVLSLASAGCGPSSSPVDAGADAGGSEDGGPLDAAAPVDAAASDAARPEDAGSPADAGAPADAGSPSDAAADVDAGGPTGPDAGACNHVAVDDVVVSCGGAYRFVSRFVSDVGGAACPPFYGFSPDGPRFDDVASAIASDATCDASCQYRFAMSVTRLYCGRRTGYEVLTATGCPDLVRFAEGYYPSVEAHDAARPCP